MREQGFPHHPPSDKRRLVLPTRRELLRSTACGFGHVALLGLLQSVSSALGGSTTPNNRPELSRQVLPHFAPRAKRVIFLFMHGGVSHIDTFDPKPKLTAMDGQPLPFEKPLQFAAVGGTAYNLAKAKGLGHPLPLEWFTQNIRD